MRRTQTSPLHALVALLLVGALLFSASTTRAEEKKPDPTPSELQTGVEEAKAKGDEGKAKSDMAWMLVSTALVMFMVPGLALFYGGIARRKNLLGTMMHSMVALSIVGIQWVLVGYCIAFGASQGGWFGWSPELLGLRVDPTKTFANTTLPILLHCMYQGMFAIITPALISGAIAERIRFGPYCLFLLLWSTLIYAPLAHWVWALDLDPAQNGAAVGWLGKMGALDFAGGTVVHVAAGFSGLAAILVLRKRLGYPSHAMHPSSMVLALFGAGLLWFGWFGFNGGSAGGSTAQAVSALTATQIAAAAAAFSWMLVEWFHRKKPTALGFATGLVAGLVAVTPASGFVDPLGALSIGLIAGVVCYIMVVLKPGFKYDDSLDAFGVHGIGGFLGAILTGVFAAPLFHQKAAGLAEPINVSLYAQFVASAAAAAYAFVGTIVLVKVLDIVCGGFCITPEEENEGLDRAVHGETAFDMGPSMEVAVGAGAEPRAATVPPAGAKPFKAIIEGVNPADLIHTWSDLCQPQPGGPSAEFRAVYPYVTTIQGTTFRFRGGDPDSIKSNLTRLLQPLANGSKVVKIRVEA